MNHPVSNYDLGGYVTFCDVDITNSKQSLLPTQGVKLFSLGRHCLEAVCRTIKPKLVHLPIYTCSSVKNTMSKFNVQVNYYSLNDMLIPDISGLELNELLVVNNYFGMLGATPSFRKWINLFPKEQLLIDNTQSLGLQNQFSELLTFVSPRKFLPVTDGGILYDGLGLINCASLPDETDVSWGRIEWLFRAIDDGGRQHSYSEYLKYRETVQEITYSHMSLVTRHLLSIFDVANLIRRRNNNFIKLNEVFPIHPCFSAINALSEFSPIGYPTFVKDAKLYQKNLAKQHIYTVRYWPELDSVTGLNAFEKDLLEHLLILPINQAVTKEQFGKLTDILIC